MSVCDFCKGQPVGNAQSWIDGKDHPPLPCPRCGETNTPAVSGAPVDLFDDTEPDPAEQAAREAHTAAWCDHVLWGDAA